jgi:hypothetical protein
MKYLGVVVISAIAAIANPTFAGQGDTVTVGSVLQSPPGQLNLLTASFVDDESGNTYNFFLEGKEGSPSLATFALEGPNLHGCTIHKSPTGPQPQLNPSATPFTYGGSLPYDNSGCGSASAQAVFIHNCFAKIQAHGFVHSDDPFVTYLGATTMEIQYRKNRTPAKDEIEIKLYTPKHSIKLEGKASVTNGTSFMSNCR